MDSQVSDLIEDLIADIRFSREKITKHINVKQETKYEELCLSQLRTIWANRNEIKFDCNGWPTCLKER